MKKQIYLLLLLLIFQANTLFTSPYFWGAFSGFVGKKCAKFVDYREQATIYGTVCGCSCALIGSLASTSLHPEFKTILQRTSSALIAYTLFRATDYLKK